MRGTFVAIFAVVSFIALPVLSLTIPTAQADPLILQSTPTLSGSSDAATQLAEGIHQLTVVFDIPAALAEFNMALETDPNLWEAYRWRALLYYDVGALNLALTDLNTLLANDPENVDALIVRARVYAGPFRVDLPYPYGWMTYHGFAGFGRQHRQAIADLEMALTLDNKNPSVWVAYGDVLAAEWFNNRMGISDLSDAEIDALHDEVFEKYATALELDPDNADALYHSGFLALVPLGLTEDYTSDEQAFFNAQLSRAMLLTLDTPHAAYAKAVLYWVNNAAEDALLELQTAIEHFPNYAPLYSWLMMMTDTGSRWADSDKDEMFVLSQRSAKQAAQIAPYSPLYLFNAAYSKYGTPDYIPALEHILEMAPDYPPALARLAYAYLNEGSSQSCDYAAGYATLYLNSNLEPYEHSLFSVEFNLPYTRNCTSPTATPVFIPVTSSHYAVGDTLTLPGFGVYPIKESPYVRDNTILCSAGTAATVLQIVQLDTSTVIYLQLECDAGVGWIEETLLP